MSSGSASRPSDQPWRLSRYSDETTSVDPGLERLAHYLDRVFRIPGTEIRFGVDPILGLIFPGAGDAMSAFLSAYIVWRSVRFGVPKPVVGRMVFNIALDYVVGSIPLLGDLFDFGFKANSKNLALLNRFASGRRSPSWKDWLWAATLLTALGFLVLAAALAIVVLVTRSDFRLV